MTRRSVVLSLLGSALLPSPGYAEHRAGFEKFAFGPERPFSFEALRAKVAAAAKAPFRPEPTPAPQVLDRLDYAALTAIQHRVEDALFVAGPGAYRATFFHLGALFRTPVRLNVVKDGAAREVLYDSALFDIPDGSPALDMPRQAGFAGFRVHKPADYPEGDGLGDFLAFLGASYFRSSGPLSQYGLSARGLAIDVAPEPPRHAEEFPIFTEFWIEPQVGAAPRICAWLESPSAVGAFRFQPRLAPGETTIDVESEIQLRADVGRLGFAPLTSMYWFSERRKDPTADWRPEVHDSDGLALLTGTGQRIWRPLSNPESVRVSSFDADGIRGFGLMQRDRDASHYIDPVRFERRPSLWIEPVGPWPDGQIELVEIPTEREYDDNIVAFFRPAKPAKQGANYRLRYRMRWIAEDIHVGDLAHCTATRMARPILDNRQLPTISPHQVSRWIVVEWKGREMESLDGVRAQITLSRGRVNSVDVEPLPGQRGAARVRFEIASHGSQQISLAMVLKRGRAPVSETWSFVIEPERGLVGEPEPLLASGGTPSAIQ